MTLVVPVAVTIALTVLLQSTGAPTSDFLGTWTMDEGRSDSAQQEKFVSPMSLVISRADATLIIETRRGDQVETIKYVIENAPETPGVVGAGTRRAYWDGQKLVTEGAGNLQGQTVSVRAVRTLNADGTEMTVESMVAVQHGYTLRGAQTYAKVRDVYTRSVK